MFIGLRSKGNTIFLPIKHPSSSNEIKEQKETHQAVGTSVNTLQEHWAQRPLLHP